jgi:hypothetical protein
MEKTTITYLKSPISSHPKLFALLLFISFGINSYGQSPSRADLSNSQTTAAATEPTAAPFQKSKAIGLNVGLLNAPGVEFAYKFAPHWAARISYGYMSYGVNNFSYTTTSTTAGTPTSLLINAKANFDNINLAGEYSVGKKGRLRLIGGVAFFPKKTIEAGGSLTSSFKFNDVTITPEDIGSGTVTLGYSTKISPYLGIGIGRLIPRKRLNISFDMGAYYSGNYKVNIDVKPGVILESNEDNAPIIERNLNDALYKVIPSFNFRIAYKL